MTERNLERAFVQTNAVLENPLGHLVEAAVLRAMIDGPQEAAAQHRRERERNDAGYQDRRADGDGKSCNNRPKTPPMKRTGINTATSEIVIETIVKPISREPSSAALHHGFPISMWRTMFSSMTIASSTTKPTESVSARSERLSRLKPNRYIAAKVPMMAMGIAMLGNDRRGNRAQEQKNHRRPGRLPVPA